MSAIPYSINIPNEVLTDLRERLKHTRWPKESENGWEYGTNQSYLRELVDYWTTSYKWRDEETKLNKLPQFTATIDDQSVYFIHVKSKKPNAIPLLLLHGWPDSFYRFHKIIPALTDPESVGIKSDLSFDVVIPSLPGFPLSLPFTSAGNIFQVHNILSKLMTDVLGYDKFGVHGGDLGSLVADHLGRSHGKHIIGLHLTDVPFVHNFQKPSDLSEKEQAFFKEIEARQSKDNGYIMVQGSRPETLASGLVDSPVGLTAWILEKLQSWSDSGNNIESNFSKDEIITLISLYWNQRSIDASFLPYYDVMHASVVTWIGEKVKEWVGTSSVPTGFTIFAKDGPQPPREWAQRFFNVQYWNSVTKGGHFAAWEQPELLAHELNEFFNRVR